MAVGSGRLAVGSWRLAVGGWRLAVGSWQLAVGSGRLRGQACSNHCVISLSRRRLLQVKMAPLWPRNIHPYVDLLRVDCCLQGRFPTK